MSLQTLTAQTFPYQERKSGTYVRSTLSFGQPDNSITLRGANPKSNPLRASISRVLQKDVVVGSNTVRKTCTVTLSIVSPDADFSATEIDSLVADISDVVNVSLINHLFSGGE